MILTSKTFWAIVPTPIFWMMSKDKISGNLSTRCMFTLCAQIFCFCDCQVYLFCGVCFIVVRYPRWRSSFYYINTLVLFTCAALVTAAHWHVANKIQFQFAARHWKVGFQFANCVFVKGRMTDVVWIQRIDSSYNKMWWHHSIFTCDSMFSKLIFLTLYYCWTIFQLKNKDSLAHPSWCLEVIKNSLS